MANEFNNKVVSATKWSAITEVCARLFMPISGLVLARLLTPEAFGIVATLTMIITLADIFSEAGFQKFIIQHEFRDEDETKKYPTVAFWSNIILSLCIWGGIAIFKDQLAVIVGSPGYGNVLLIACANIPLVGFSSIQTAIYRRDLNFKTLFYVRISTIIVPLVITIPLAFILRSFWALVIGTLAKNLLSSLVLLYYSKWKPTFFYSCKILKDMLSFSLWSMVETLSIWLNQYADVFIIGTLLSSHFLGLYKTTITTVGQMIGIVTSILTPVIFSTLSRLQSNDKDFFNMYFKFQKVVAILVLPIGTIVFAEKELVTSILLGSQWSETAGFMGLWALMGSISVALSRYCTEMYRAKGHPMLCFLVQFLMFIVLVPGVLYTARIGFKELYIFRSLLELEYIVVNLIICYILFKLSPFQHITNILRPIIASIVVLAFILILKPIYESVLYQIVISALGFLIYCSVIYSSKEDRKLILNHILKR